jgi:hypothetical protein
VGDAEYSWSQPRLISDNPEYRNLPAQAVNGWQVGSVTIERVDKSYQIAWISVADGSVKVLKSFDWKHYPDYHARLSPDGRFIAYSAEVREDLQKATLMFYLGRVNRNGPGENGGKKRSAGLRRMVRTFCLSAIVPALPTLVYSCA